MRIFKTKPFGRWAQKEGLADAALRQAVRELQNGLVDADLGGQVYKKRVGLAGRGKRGGVRTLIAFQHQGRAVFLYGFAKNERANIGERELKGLRLLAGELLSYSDRALAKAIGAGALTEVDTDEQ